MHSVLLIQTYSKTTKHLATPPKKREPDGQGQWCRLYICVIRYFFFAAMACSSWLKPLAPNFNGPLPGKSQKMAGFCGKITLKINLKNTTLNKTELFGDLKRCNRKSPWLQSSFKATIDHDEARKNNKITRLQPHTSLLCH